MNYAQNHPTLCSIVLDQPRITTQSEWHLPTWDDRNEKRWSHKLYTIDLYFWTERDANTFMNQIKSVVSPAQLNAGQSSARPSEHRDSMSPVVQQLEQTAIGAQYPPRAGSTTSAQSLPGPPTPASNSSVATTPAVGGYNPAAPAAPEPIAHREKTPPPPDGAHGTGLTNAVRYDSMPQQYSNLPQHQYAQYPQQTPPSVQTTPQTSYFPGTSQSAAPPQPVQKQASFGPQAPSTISTQFSGPPQASTYAPGNIYAQQPPTPSAPPAYAQYASQAQNIPPPPSSAASSNPRSPPATESPQQRAHQVAGFSSYSYSGNQNAPSGGQYNQHGAFTGNMHAQVYRPTEAEAAHGHHGKPAANQEGKRAEDRFGDRINKVEKGFNHFLKKLDSL